MYDIIGDIHGHTRELKQLLRLMDYSELNGVWKHPVRKAIFIGDYIDRGPQIRETLQIVHQMTMEGAAIALLGNHEYNALAYHYKLPDGSYLRSHNDKHSHQHRETLEQFKNYESDWKTYLEWFYTLPLFIDYPEFRAVHACWDDAHINWLKENNHQTMSEPLLVDSHKKDHKAYQVIEDVLKGKEIVIPEKFAWKDKDGHVRIKNRIRWWMNSKESSYGEYLFNCPTQLETNKISDHFPLSIYPENAPPVFFGHYWLSDDVPSLQASNIACLDYSIAKGGNLVAYRFNGEGELSQKSFIGVTGF